MWRAPPGVKCQDILDTFASGIGWRERAGG
jgi:hypothetical protein